MSHDIFLGEMYDGDIVEAAQRFERVGEARARARRQIDLARITCHNHARAFAETGQKHLHLYRRRVLRLVEDDKGASQRAAAHESDRCHLDLAGAEAFGDLDEQESDSACSGMD